jgi:hypothetical protein
MYVTPEMTDRQPSPGFREIDRVAAGDVFAHARFRGSDCAAVTTGAVVAGPLRRIIHVCEELGLEHDCPFHEGPAVRRARVAHQV